MDDPLSRLDAALARSRFAWIGLGQLALIGLGLHLAADHLDDQVYAALSALVERLAGPLETLGLAPASPDDLLEPSAWIALALELLTLLHAFNCITLTPLTPNLSPRGYRDALSVHALVLPLYWAPTALAGAWVVGMSVEDALAPFAPTPARWLGVITSVLIAWRLGLSGLARVIGGLSAPKSRLQGILWAPLLLTFAALAAWYGLPWRGVLS